MDTVHSLLLTMKLHLKIPDRTKHSSTGKVFSWSKQVTFHNRILNPDERVNDLICVHNLEGATSCHGDRFL
jgi:hypothetical protein